VQVEAQGQKTEIFKNQISKYKRPLMAYTQHDCDKIVRAFGSCAVG